MRKISRDGKLTFDNVGQPQPETVSCDAGHFLQGMLWDTYGAPKTSHSGGRVGKDIPRKATKTAAKNGELTVNQF